MGGTNAELPLVTPYAYELPIPGRSCGGFSVSNGAMYLFEYSNRQLYKVSRDSKLQPHENVKGMYVVDVSVVDGQPYYCSRNRIFTKVRGTMQLTPIKGSEELISITSDTKEIFLLEAAPKSRIIVLDKRTGKERRHLVFRGREPADLAVGAGYLWVFDRGDQCIHQVNKKNGRTLRRIQAGPGVARGSNGLLFKDGHLYIHEGDYARLRRVDWERNGYATLSWQADMRMTFVQKSWNEHDTATTTVSFKVPTPQNRSTQTVGTLSWSQPPSTQFKDKFGQPIAKFDNIRIGPGMEHVLKYSVDVSARAIQYDPPRLPLSGLTSIDKTIRDTYLASNRLYQMDTAELRAAAVEARKDGKGKEPTNIRSLIENIATYVIKRTDYQLDDSWKDAATILKSKKGSCSEYSFLFSALCRLNQVPTRLVGGIEFGDYGTKHETRGFHRWTEVWYPKLGWLPVDVTKIDGAKNSYDYEFLFGTPGYILVLSEGDFDPNALGMTYYIWRSYRGGKRKRTNHVSIESSYGTGKFPVVKLIK